MQLPEKDKDDGTFNLNDLGYDLPDLCGVCGGAPTDKETVLRTPAFFFKQHSPCVCYMQILDQMRKEGEHEE